MVRIAKKQEIRNHRKRKSKGVLGTKTGPKVDNISKGYIKRENAIQSNSPLSKILYVPKGSSNMKSRT